MFCRMSMEKNSHSRLQVTEEREGELGGVFSVRLSHVRNLYGSGTRNISIHSELCLSKDSSQFFPPS